MRSPGSVGAPDSAKLKSGLSTNLELIKMELGQKVKMDIGQKVKVRRLRDRVSGDIVNKLGKVGTIKEYKMTDGSGVGAIVQFDDKTSAWFFEDELQPA